ncbi:MAG: SidE phosphodiesterase domain-containing protein [Parachlamydiales bacterium]|jgi:hypothetical protein
MGLLTGNSVPSAAGAALFHSQRASQDSKLHALIKIIRQIIQRVFQLISACFHGLGCFFRGNEAEVQGAGALAAGAAGDLTDMPGVSALAFQAEGDSKTILVKVPKFQEYRIVLTEANLPLIFKAANHYTMNQPYPNDLESDYQTIKPGANVFKPGAAVLVYRPNHNGTHGARQARMMQGLLDFVKTHGSEEQKTAVCNLTEVEKLALLLAAYLIRSGRYHDQERSDDHRFYQKRSALIFIEYAKHLGLDEKSYMWIAECMRFSCVPYSSLRVKSPEFKRILDTNPKANLAWSLLNAAHRFDLIRCCREDEFASKGRDPLKNFFNIFFTDRAQGQKAYEAFLNFSIQLCEVTGSQIALRDRRFQDALFERCSLEGDFCWSQLQHVSFPEV